MPSPRPFPSEQKEAMKKLSLRLSEPEPVAIGDVPFEMRPSPGEPRPFPSEVKETLGQKFMKVYKRGIQGGLGVFQGLKEMTEAAAEGKGVDTSPIVLDALAGLKGTREFSSEEILSGLYDRLPEMFPHSTHMVPTNVAEASEDLVLKGVGIDPSLVRDPRKILEAAGAVTPESKARPFPSERKSSAAPNAAEAVRDALVHPLSFVGRFLHLKEPKYVDLGTIKDAALFSPAVAADISIQFLADPLVPVLGAIGEVSRIASKVPKIAKGLAIAANFVKDLPGAKLFMRPGAEVPGYLELKDSVRVRTANIERDAYELAKEIRDTLTVTSSKYLNQVLKRSKSGVFMTPVSRERAIEIASNLAMGPKTSAMQTGLRTYSVTLNEHNLDTWARIIEALSDPAQASLVGQSVEDLRKFFIENAGEPTTITESGQSIVKELAALDKTLAPQLRAQGFAEGGIRPPGDASATLEFSKNELALMRRLISHYRDTAAVARGVLRTHPDLIDDLSNFDDEMKNLKLVYENSKRLLSTLEGAQSKMNLQTATTSRVMTSGLAEQDYTSLAKTAAKSSLLKINDLAKRAFSLQQELEASAKDVGLLRDTFRARLPRKKFAALVDELNSAREETRRLVTDGAFRQKIKILELSNQVRVNGNHGLADRLRKFAEETVYLKTEDLRNSIGKIIDEFDTVRINVPRQNEIINRMTSLVKDLAKDPRVNYDDMLPEFDELAEMTGKFRSTGDLRKVLNSLQKSIGATRKERLVIRAGEILSDLAQLKPVMNPVDKANLITMLGDLDRSTAREADKITGYLFDIMDRVDNLRVSGLKTLVDAISNVKGRFAGRAERVRELITRMDTIKSRIINHYIYGGGRTGDGVGYLPRLYELFESKIGKMFLERGIGMDELTEMLPEEIDKIMRMSEDELQYYFSVLDKRGGKKLFSAMQARIRGQRFKQRNLDLEYEIRHKVLGEIETAEYPFFKGMSTMARDVEWARFFKAVAENPEWTLSESAAANIAEKGGIGALRNTHYQLNDAPSLGALRNKWVLKSIGHDVDFMTRAPGPLRQWWIKALSLWKFGKVIMSPNTQFRNIISSGMLLDMGGMDLVSQMYWAPRVAREIAHEGPMFTKYLRAGLFGSEYVGGEVKSLIPQNYAGDLIGNSMHQALKFATEPAEFAAKSYQKIEQFNKLMMAMYRESQGFSVAEALAEGEKWGINYIKVSRATRFLRETPLGSPFITFTAKTIPLIAETMVKNPLRIAKYYVFMRIMEDEAKKKYNLTDDDILWMKRRIRGYGIVMPVDDGRSPLAVDLSYYFPWGNFYQGYGFGGEIGGALAPLLDLRSNKEWYTGRQIYDPTDEAYLKFADTAAYLAKSFLPSLTPGVPGRTSPIRGGYSFEKLVQSTLKLPDGSNRIRSMSRTIADIIFGLKTIPVDPGEQHMFAVIVAKKEIGEAIVKAKKRLRLANFRNDTESAAQERIWLQRKILRTMKSIKTP